MKDSLMEPVQHLVSDDFPSPAANGGGVEIISSPAHEAERIRDAVARGVAVAVFDATGDAVNAVRAAAGLPEDAAQGPLSLYAVASGAAGGVRELAVAPPAEGEQAVVVWHTGSEETGTIAETREEPAPVGDRPDPRREVLSAWLAETAAADETPGALAGDTSFAVDRADAGAMLSADDADSRSRSIEEVVNAFEQRHIFQFRRNVHSLTTRVWAVHDATRNEDWFFVRQQGLFSAANEILPDGDPGGADAMNRGRFTDLYTINTRVPGWENTPSVWLEHSSPLTAEKVQKVTSSVSWNLTGKLSANVKAAEKPEAGGGAEISGGVSMNQSFSFDVNDVTTSNQSGTAANDAGWRFDIAWPTWSDGFGCIGFLGLGPLPSVAKGTFQPVLQWIWRVSAEVRERHPAGLPVEVTFGTRVRHIYYGPGCSWNFTNWNHPSGPMAQGMVVPWPPRG